MKKITMAILAACSVAAPGAATAGTAQAAPTGVGPAPATVTIGSLNTKHAAAKMTGFADVVGWQEADSYGKVNGVAKLRKRMQQAGYAVVSYPGAAGADSISFNAQKFTLNGSGKLRTHKGRHNVTPARFVTWVDLTDKATGKQFIVVDTQFISNAFTSHPERRKKWNKHAAMLAQEVQQLEQTNPGVPVFVVGDFNRKTGLALAGERKLATKGRPRMPGYDQVYVSTSVHSTKAKVLPTYGSDHNARRAKVSW